MVWSEVSIEDFPPRRDDEPASLRQDIIDELTDHFVCALNRELLKNSDEQLARQRVLNQFGDPIKIARRLWFDAMKEKIMSQRIMTGVCVVMAVCGFIVVGLVWSMMKQNERVNLQMLEQLAVIAARPETEPKNIKNLEMNQVSFHLVQATKGGKPAVGFTGKLTKSGKQTDTFTVNAVSNDSGELDFGTLPWGKYQLKVNAPWGESYFDKNITVIPGRGFTETIVCPVAEPETVPVQFQVDWPDKLKSEDWVLLCDFRTAERQNAAGMSGGLIRKYANNKWNSSKGLNAIEGQVVVFLIDHNDQVSLCPLTGMVSSPGNYKDIDPEDLAGKPSVNLIEGEGYSLPVINLIPKKDLSRLSQLNVNQTFSVINPERNVFFPFVPAERFKITDFPPSIFLTTVLLPFGDQASHTDSVDSTQLNSLPKTVNGIELSKRLNFSVSKDQKNVWKIQLPDLEKLKVLEGTRLGKPSGVGGGFF